MLRLVPRPSISISTDFRQAVPDQIVTGGPGTVVVRGVLPGTARPTVIGPAQLPLTPGSRTAVMAVGAVASIEPLVISRDVSPVAAGDLLIAAVQNTSTGSAPISLLATTTSGSTLNILDRATPAGVRVVHASPDAPAVDIVVNNSFAQPLVAGLSFRDVTPFVSIPGGSYNTKVTAAGNPGAIVIDANPAFVAGQEYSVLAVGTLATIEPRVLTENRRRIATQAKVRIIHASPAAGPEDLYVVAPGASIQAAAPVFTAVPFEATTGYVSLAAGSYDVVVTAAGSKTPAIGSAAITVANRGVYTIAARDAVGGGTPLGVISLDDAP